LAGLELTLKSGHYQTPRSGVRGDAYMQIARNAFEVFGVYFP
jgi:hypothetical protein